MKKSLSVIIAGAVLMFLLSSCAKDRVTGNGPVVAETRPLSNFRGVSYAVSGKLNFKIDPVYKVEIMAQRNILDVLRTDIINGVLKIEFRNNVRVRDHEDIIVNISAPSTDYLKVSGVGDISLQGDDIINRLDMEVSGVGNIWIQKAIVADRIDARISGSGNITVAEGSAKNEELHISGSGSMDLSNVTAEKAGVHISGSGDMKVNLSQSLEAYISGSGTVYYRGSPTVSTHISGSGNVRPL